MSSITFKHDLTVAYPLMYSEICRGLRIVWSRPPDLDCVGYSRQSIPFEFRLIVSDNAITAISRINTTLFEGLTEVLTDSLLPKIDQTMSLY